MDSLSNRLKSSFKEEKSMVQIFEELNKEIKMDKLELKDIAPYLQYNLQMQYEPTREIGVLESILHANNEYDELRFGISTMFQSDHYWLFKPILRPMTDLTKEITHNGETFIPIARLLRMKFPDEPLIGRYSIIKVSKSGYPRACFEFMSTKEIRIYPFELFDAPYWIIQKLQEWQFDTEKLIERGLAINLNEVDNGK
ncbi:hypothetical protein NV63_06780 [Elizabethkingia anophelis]|nr:hypothetical protein NV63_06780 [Elizabethkingia anophelis]